MRTTTLTRQWTAAIAAAAIAFGAGAATATTAGAGSPVASHATIATPAVQLSLGSIACLGANLCFAVGDRSPDAPYIEKWDGRRWSHSGVPTVTDAELSGVSCADANSCFAVGAQGKQTLVERWNGTRWAVMTSPRRSGATGAGLTSISCVSGESCFAVGSFVSASEQGTLVEHWNGVRWTIMSSPNVSWGDAFEDWLNGVSCANTTHCFAVGSVNIDDVDDTLVLGWNGTKWSVSTHQNPDGLLNWLEGVSCATATSCVAVGQVNTAEPTVPLEDVWNGKGWRLTVSPPGNTELDLDAVSCPTATSCVAVGAFGRALAERRSGAKWTPLPPPKPPVIAISCATPSNCYGLGSGAVVRWNGSSWSVVARV